MTTKEPFTADKTTPFWDASLPVETRIDWLLTHMTIEEKLGSMSSFSKDLPRLGIPAMGAGGEAAHGVEGRNDQNGLGTPDISTSFPQPIGMSATWDKKLIKEAGEIVGREARVIYHRHPRFGLSRWAPTVDLERDPRWGRNEEGYGEDPYLTGEMAGAYIRGIQGDDPKYLQCAATLKHFYANNTEKRRCFVNTTIDPRNKYEYYMDVFRRCIEKGRVEGVMTAYNGINGIPGILNPEVKDVLKGKYGLTHAVSDGSATVLVVKQHHFFGIHAETVAAALKAGIDAFSDKPDNVDKAIREAYELKLIGEADLDRALANMLRTKIKLGIYDAIPSNPYDMVGEEDLCTEASARKALEMACESVVLLKNDRKLLPMTGQELGEAALIGPLSDAWYMDWYGGRPPYLKTLKDGIEELTGKEITSLDGRDRILLRLADGSGRGLAVDAAEKLIVSDSPDVFILEDWGEDSINLRCERTGKYINCAHPDSIAKESAGMPMNCSKEETFDWFVLELMHILTNDDGTVRLTNRFDFPLQLAEDDSVVSMRENLQAAAFEIEVVRDGIREAVAYAKEKQTVILTLGCNPMINAKEEIDRKTIDLPPRQKELFDAVYEVNQNIILVLFCNYPYALHEVADKAKAILWSATGGQDMGSAVTMTLCGDNAPAGRLNQTWYCSDEDLYPMEDYDIIQHPRTYRYFEREVLYPFGYGLTYSSFAYSNLSLEYIDGAKIRACFDISNTGTATSDEVVQIYASFPACRVKRPLKQLVAFERVKDMAPGETRTISLDIMTEDLRYYDVISETLLLEEGIYTFFAGGSSADEASKTELFLKGVHPGMRDLAKYTAVERFDEQENVELTVGHFHFSAAKVMEGEKNATLVYRECAKAETASELVLHMFSEKQSEIRVKVDGVLRGCFEGNTVHYEVAKPFLWGERAKDDFAYQEAHRCAQYTDVVIPLSGVETKEAFTLELCVSGDAKICYFYMK